MDGILSALKTTLFGLSSQMKRMELISENIANVDKSPDENGRVYQKKSLLESGNDKSKIRRFTDAMRLSLRRTDTAHFSGSKSVSKIKDAEKDLKVVEQKGEKLVFNPAHPKADEKGYVKMPNVNLVEEMVDLISVSRVYEANVTVINAAKQMAKRSLDI